MSVGRGRTLVAGIGNIFFGDDAFGVEVARHLLGEPTPAGVEIADFGIRGVDLAYALLDRGYENVILVDAVQRGGPAGSVYLIEPLVEGYENSEGRALIAETHGLDPAKVLSWVYAMGGSFRFLRLVGCEPAFIGSDSDMRMGLTPEVQRAVEEASRLIKRLVTEKVGDWDA